MEITYLVIIGLITYILGSITKTFITKVPCKFIPLQNVIIGLISGFVCYYMKINTELLNSIIMCLIACMGAGGANGILKLMKGEK